MGKFERQEKEEIIIRAAARVFFIKGFGGTKMEDVAREAGFSKGSVYFYFKHKEDLYMALIYHALQLQIAFHEEQFELHKGKTGLQIILNFIEAYFEFVEQNQQIHSAITDYINLANPGRQQSDHYGLTDGMTSSAYYHKILNIQFTPAMMMLKVILQGVEDDSIRNKADFSLLYVTLWSMVLGYEKLSDAERYFSKAQHPVMSYFSIDRQAWKKMIVQTARILLTTENMQPEQTEVIPHYENIQG